ncbi:PPE family protein [Mycobacterium branderi]|uniref:PPE family protein n=1 Tax=Mycobacterium branderi TaxID=43348 RepID=UPI00111C8600
MDFAVLPPEINSGRMYAGAGAGPMMAAAAAWDGLAAELSSAATSYQSVVSGLTGGPWLGPASSSMAAAAAPYVAWMNTTAAQAEQTANQARAAAAAYEAAFTATVPPPVIAANRALLMTLIATNILGQNTPAIAATEAHYAEMWAQDAAAMYGYAGTSAAATQLAPFNSAPQNTNPASTGAQSAAVSQATSTSTATGGVSQTLSQIPQALQGLATGGASTDPSQWLLNLLNSPLVQDWEGLMAGTAGYQALLGGPAFMASGALFCMTPFENAAISYALAGAAAPAAEVSALPEAALGSALAGTSESAGLGAGVSASLGEASSVGGLSVPQSWGSAASEIQLAARALPMASLDGLPTAGLGGSFGGMPMVGPIGSVVNAPRNGEPRPRYRADRAAKRQPGDETPGRWANFDGFAPDGQAPLSEREQLHQLRTAIADVTKERDVLKRSAALLIKEAMHQGTP